MDNSQTKWTEADFPDNDGVLVTGDDVFFTPKALAKRLGLSEDAVVERMKRKRIPSIRGFVDGERMVPLSMLSGELERRKGAESGSVGSYLPDTEGITPGARAAAEVLASRRK